MLLSERHTSTIRNGIRQSECMICRCGVVLYVTSNRNKFYGKHSLSRNVAFSNAPSTNNDFFGGRFSFVTLLLHITPITSGRNIACPIQHTFVAIIMSSPWSESFSHELRHPIQKHQSLLSPLVYPNLKNLVEQCYYPREAFSIIGGQSLQSQHWKGTNIVPPLIHSHANWISCRSNTQTARMFRFIIYLTFNYNRLLFT